MSDGTAAQALDDGQFNFFMANIGLGPIIGLAVTPAFTLTAIALQPPVPGRVDHFDLGGLIGGIGFMVLFAHALGIVPAMLHAMTILVIWRWRLPLPVYLAIVAVSGFCWTIGFSAAMSLGTPSYLRQESSQSLLNIAGYGLVGLIPALACALIARRPAGALRSP